jgi:DNA-binding Lrp family transcriptional regulator
MPVTEYELDDVDRQLLDLLQDDARYTAVELAEAIGVSDNTVHNRMDRLEEVGIITGYRAGVDHDRAGLGLYFQFDCTAHISDRGRVAEEALAIPEVVEVTELMTGQENVQIKACGRVDEDITRVAEELDGLDLEINDENLVREEHVDPLDFVAVEERMTED